jgi:molybdenum cofactor cytidylyltransferase
VIFGSVPLAQARGGILAHSLKTADRVLRKGALVDSAALALLSAAGYDKVTVARLEPGDVPEGEAAARLGELLLRDGLRRSDDFHGRINIFALADGLLRLDVDKILQINMVDEAITLATLPDKSVVAKGDMIATLKIIPFAVTGDTMAITETLIKQGDPAMIVKPFQPLKVGLVLTQLPHVKDAALTSTIAATRARIETHGGVLLTPIITPHETQQLTSAIKDLVRLDADLVLVSGASAVTDREDVAPRAIVEAGGQIVHFGMPVDPGNLICFGKIGPRHAIILPGCARSPKLNGIDWVLDMIFAGESLKVSDVAKMGVGGLLKEIETRPAPRAREQQHGVGVAPKAKPRVAALVLAAGMSRRMAPLNKLLIGLPSGQTMIAQTVDRVLASSASPVIVITGHEEVQIKQALVGKNVRFVFASDHAGGLAASLRAGVSALSENVGAAVICLGDMPLIDPETINRMVAAFDPSEGREIIIPTFDGQRGNPVLWGRRFFSALAALSGDSGARQIFHKHMEFVSEVNASNDSVLRDFDTLDSLQKLR